MSDYSRWKDTVEKYDKEDGICPLLDDVYEQGRADAIKEVIQKYDDVICEDCIKCGGHCRYDEVMSMLEQLKEQKNE